MEENVMNPAVPDAGLCGCDREVFERVWRRVMPDGGDCPIRIEPAARPEPERALPAVPAPEREEEQADIVCLGRASVMYGARLEEMIDAEMEDWRTYQGLARRAGGSAARALGSLAAEERRHVKRLATAYFLITGQRYQGRGQGGGRPAVDLMLGLREQYIREQRGAAAYQSAAEEASDPCLRQLFGELAEEESLHAQAIRGLLEQM